MGIVQILPTLGLIQSLLLNAEIPCTQNLEKRNSDMEKCNGDEAAIQLSQELKQDPPSLSSLT